MRRITRFMLVALLTGTLVPASCRADEVAAAETWKAGTARINITPQRPMWMAGYASRDRPSEGKLTDIWAKALVLEDPMGHRGVLITLDLIGIDRDLSLSICTQLSEKNHLQRDQIAICSSHTHTGPALQKNLAPLHYLVVDPRQQSLIEDYTRELEIKLVNVVGDALQSLEPCRLSWGVGETTFATNRRENSEQDARSLRLAGQLKGPVDHSVPVLAVRDLDGHLKSIVFGYACHATTLSFYEWSGDYPGFAQLELEERHPDCLAMFWAGCGADQNPLPRGSVELCKHYGHRLASAVDAVLLTTSMHDIGGQLTTRYRELDLAFADVPNRQQIEADAESTNRYTASRGKMFLAQLASGKPLSTSYSYPIGLWKFGDHLQWITLGGEVVVDYAIRLKAEFAGHSTWVAGYAHDVMAYIPSRRVLLEGGYEGGGAMVYYGLPSAWSTTIENDIVETVKAMSR